MTKGKLNIEWPNGQKTLSEPGKAWLSLAREAGVVIPTGCLTGSCGACEIEVNGKVVRACISSVPKIVNNELSVEFFYDPFW